LELAELEFEEPQTWWEEAHEWLSWTDRHLPHIRTHSEEFAVQYALAHQTKPLELSYTRCTEHELGKQ